MCVGSSIIATVGIILVVVGLILLWFSLPLTLRAVRQNRRAVALPSRIEDMTAESQMPDPPANARTTLAALQRLGFGAKPACVRRLYYGDEEPTTSWIYVDASRVIAAEVGSAPNAGFLTILGTWFQSEHYVQTVYPWGVNVNTPDFVSTVVKTSLADAFQQHKTQVESEREAIPIEALPVALTQRFYERFAPLQNRRLGQLTSMYGAVTVALSLASIVGGFVLITTSDSLPLFVAILVGLTLCAGVLIASVRRFVGGLLKARREN